MPKQYTEEFKKQIVLSYQNGTPMFAVCEKHHIAQSTLYRWLKEYETTAQGQTMLDYNRLLRQHARLDYILQIIRLSGIIDAVLVQKRLEILVKLHEQFNQYNAHDFCEALAVSRGTFYKHIFRKADRTKYLEEQQAVKLRIQQIFDDSKQRYGAEKIRVTLAENGIKVGTKRIRSIMQELGLESIRENAKRDYKKRREYQKRNLLNQNFSAKLINEVWVSDITYFKIKDYAVYLCVIIDLFSRRVVGYRASKKSSTHLVMATFKATFQD